MGLNLEYDEGQTPLDPDEQEGLLIPTIATRGELDEFEQQNIEQAILWSLGRSLRSQTILSETFIRRLHQRMYGNVWAWAGAFRTTNKNIGVDKWQIATELRMLLDDASFWMANDTFPSDEMALRFKHRLVSIHCFANGNGRHSRLMADLIIDKLFGLPVFTWGGANMLEDGDIRSAYLHAVRAADSGDMQPLLIFARS